MDIRRGGCYYCSLLLLGGITQINAVFGGLVYHYAQLINGGSRVYRDFDYLFTPFYIYLIAFVTKVFGYRIIVLRIMGMIFTVLWHFFCI